MAKYALLVYKTVKNTFVALKTLWSSLTFGKNEGIIMGDLLKPKDVYILYILLSLVYISGLFIPLMENDSAQHAVTGMRIFLNNDFLHLIKGGTPYLDKPHLHFWLVAISYKIFGISHWAYRIPSLLFTLLGAFSCYKLSQVFYNRKSAHLASLIFLTAQAIILSNHDVRTDAILTGATIFAVWQLIQYIDTQKFIYILLGALGTALAFSAKGQLGVFVIGICILVYLIQTKSFTIIFYWKVLAGLIAYAIFITPVLYAYYIQFGQLGIQFILWDQSLNRLTATGFEETSPDYFFFFHTFLWAFLPWSFIAVFALVHKLKILIISPAILKEKYNEVVTAIGFLIILVVISFSKFKLPHYLNSLLPLTSILCAGYLSKLIYFKRKKAIRILYISQIIIIGLGSAFVIFLIFWAFPELHLYLLMSYLIIGTGIFIWLIKKMILPKRIIILSVAGMVFINFCLNTQFYPNLLKFQAGNNAIAVLKSENVDLDYLYRYEGKSSWSLDFYAKRIIPELNEKNIQSSDFYGKWLFIYDQDFKSLEKQISFSEKFTIYHYRITRLTAKFLNPALREELLDKAYLIKLN